LFIAAYYCGDPTTSLLSQNKIVKEGVSLSSPATQGAEVEIECFSGFRWISVGGFNKTISCNNQGKWDIGNISHCVGNIIFIYHYFSYFTMLFMLFNLIFI